LGRTSNGQWIQNFDPLQYGANGGNPFTEGNAWQWLWYVPHDIDFIISRQTLNSQPHPDPFLSHEEIMEGGTLEVWMTKQ